MKLRHIQSGKDYDALGFVTYKGEPCVMVAGDGDGEPIRPMLAKMFTYLRPKKASDGPISEEAMDCAELLLVELKRNFAAMRRPSSLRKWASDIQKIVTHDGGNYADVRKAIVWCQRDQFWFKNIMSGEKLRKHYAKLLVQMRDKGPARGNEKPFGQDISGL